MAPGENRWIEVHVPVGAEEGAVHAVEFFEIDSNRPLNGFTIASEAVSAERALAHHLDMLGSVATRSAAVADSEQLARVADHAFEVAGARRIDKRSASRLVLESTPLLATVPKATSVSRDPLGIGRAARELLAAVDQGVTWSAMHADLLSRVDVLLTMHHKSGGDIADIPQTFRMQRDVFSNPLWRRTRAGRALVDAAEAFLDNVRPGEFWKLIDTYPSVVEGLIAPLTQAAKRVSLDDRALRIDELASALERSPAAVQRAHLLVLIAVGDANAA
jgi:hypothetical protein